VRSLLLYAGVCDLTMSINRPLFVHHAFVQQTVAQRNNSHFATVLRKKRSHIKCCPGHVLCFCGSCAVHSKSHSEKRNALLAQQTTSNRISNSDKRSPTQAPEISSHSQSKQRSQASQWKSSWKRKSILKLWGAPPRTAR
jgi:hypothetical protein